MVTAPVWALHIKGGWMSYKYGGKDASGNLLYTFTVKVFRDCGTQSPGQNDVSINISIFPVGSTSTPVTFPAGLTRNYILQKTSFNPCISPVPDVCYVILEYQGTVTVAPNAPGYIASFQRCCRIGGIVNVGGASNNLGNTYSIRLPGNAISANHLENSSPIFAEKDTAIVCFKSTFSLDYSAIDPDGDSLTYEFSPALSGASSNSPAPIAASAPPYSSVPYVNPYSAENPFGTNVSIDPATGIITGSTPDITGEYVLAVTVKEYRNGDLIAETRKELHVNVANCAIPEADLPVETINCDGFEVQFENGSLSPVINSYYWDFGVPNRLDDTTTVVRPSFIYPDSGIYIAKLVVNRGQPCSDSTTMEVKIFPDFNPGFIADGACFSNPFLFTDTTKATYGVVNNWRWDFGNPNATNDTSRLRTPSYTFPSPGTYQITLRTVSTKGCDKTVTVPLEVFDRPALNLPFRDTLICSIDSLQLQAIGSGNFTWTPSSGSIINANTPTPTVFPKTTSTYSVRLNDRGCITTDSVKVNVLDFITVNAGRDTTICRGDTIALQPITAGLSFQWSPASTLSNPQVRNPLATPVDAITTYTVVANLGKCQDTDNVTIRTVPYPTSNAGADIGICFGDSILLSGTGNGTIFRWRWNNSTDTAGVQNILVRPTQTTTYTFQVFNNLGCPKPGIDNVIVSVTPQIVVFAGRDTSAVFDQPLFLQATSNATINTWTNHPGLSNNRILNPVLTVSRNMGIDSFGFIRLEFIGTTPDGCTASDDILIRIFSTGPSIFVPNAFTPNGDGLNDKIRPITAGVERLDFFRIFNRYGQIIFETTNPESSWDGTIKGKLQGNGTFIYQVQALDYTGEVLRQKGTFNLIR